MGNNNNNLKKKKGRKVKKEGELIMIHGEKELEHLTKYSQVSEIKLDEEWTYEIQRKAALASQQSSISTGASTGYDNKFKTMSGNNNNNNNIYEGISPYFQCFRNLKSSL